MNDEERDQVVGILEALAVAVQSRRTWYDVNKYNQERHKPIEAVTAILAATAARQGFAIDTQGEPR